MTTESDFAFLERGEKKRKLFVRTDLPATKTNRINCVVVFSHGLHEHSSRFAETFSLWASAKYNIASVSFDHIGHGKSDNYCKIKHQIESFEKCVEDFRAVVEYAQMRFGRKVPVALAGVSLGGLFALRCAMTYPKNYFLAIVLIAPAFLVKKEKEQKKNATTLDGENEEVAKKKPIPKKKIVTPDDEFYDEELFNRVVLSSLKALFGWIKTSLFNLLAKPLLYVLLRTIVRSKQFWRNGLSNVVAKSKASLVDESWIDGYRRPRMVQNWDLGMINFVSASLNDLGADLKAIFRRHMRIYADKPNEYDVSMDPMDALKKSACEKNIPILIVHGNEDKVVPISNSVNIYNRLITAPKVEKNNEMEIPSQASSSSSSSSSSSKLQQSPPPLTKFVVMENTGHCPHEEDPETLASVVRDFLREASVM